MVPLTKDQRNAAIQMHHHGTSQAVITRHFQVSKSMITRFCQGERQMTVPKVDVRDSRHVDMTQTCVRPIYVIGSVQLFKRHR